jgi:hypothetical protein
MLEDINYLVRTRPFRRELLDKWVKLIKLRKIKLIMNVHIIKDLNLTCLTCQESENQKLKLKFKTKLD